VEQYNMLLCSLQYLSSLIIAMVTPDPEKHVTGSLGLALGLGLTLTLTL